MKKISARRQFLSTLLVLGIAVGAVAWSQNPPSPDQQLEAAPTPSPTSVPRISTSQITPDGTRTARLEIGPQKAQLYIDEALAYTRRNTPNSQLSLPFNAWSPDNKHLFLAQVGGDTDDYLVFKNVAIKEVDNAPISVLERFSEAYSESEIVNATGWAAPTLLIVNAKDTNGNLFSLWFDLSTQRFIRLASNFY